MVRALRVVTVERGIDPRRFALLAFGGAGPLHAAAIADELGITRIVCPRASGVLAALGLVISPRRRDVQRSVFLAGSDLTAKAVAAVVAELGDVARDALGEPAAELRATYELRYRGQAFELAIGAGAAPAVDELRGAFEAGARGPLRLQRLRAGARAGHRPRDSDGAGRGARAGAAMQTTTEHARRAATLDGPRVSSTCCGAPRRPDRRSPGPPWSSWPSPRCWSRSRWSGAVDATGTILLERAA